MHVASLKACCVVSTWPRTPCFWASALLLATRTQGCAASGPAAGLPWETLGEAILPAATHHLTPKLMSLSHHMPLQLIFVRNSFCCHR